MNIRYRGDTTTRLEYLEEPITAPVSPPPPQPTAASQATAEAINTRIDTYRKGDTR